MKDAAIRNRMVNDLLSNAASIRDELRVYGDEFTEIEKTRLRTLAKSMDATIKVIEAQNDRDNGIVPKRVYPARQFTKRASVTE